MKAQIYLLHISNFRPFCLYNATYLKSSVTFYPHYIRGCLDVSYGYFMADVWTRPVTNSIMIVNMLNTPPGKHELHHRKYH